MLLFFLNRVFNIVSALIVSFFIVSNLVQFQTIGIEKQLNNLANQIPDNQHTLFIVLAIAVWLGSEVFGLLERQSGRPFKWRD